MLEQSRFPTIKPSGATGLNLGNPLVRKLSHIYPLWQDDLVARDVKGMRNITFGTSTAQPGWGSNRYGKVLTMDGGDNAYHTSASITGSASFPIVMVVCGYFNSSGNNWPLIGLGRSASGGGDNKTIRLGSSTTIEYLTRENFGSTATASINVGTSVGPMYCAVSQSLSATDHRLYVNGVMATSTTNTGSPASAYNKIGLGASWTNGSTTPALTLNGGLLFGAVGFEQLTDSEALELTKNPSVLFEMFITKRLWFPISSGTNIYTLNPTGTLDLSGSPTINKIRAISSTGNVTFSGSSQYSKTKTQTASGTLSFSGSSSVLSNRVFLPTGQITFSGLTPSIKVKVVSATGGVDLTGNAPIYVPGSEVQTTKLPLTGVGT